MKRIFHHWEKWECFKSGFYNTTLPKNIDGRKEYGRFLSNRKRFKFGLERVLNEWPNSCEHFLSNESINRIAWLGQAAMCIETGIPSVFRGGYKLLNNTKQKKADKLAMVYLKKWERQCEQKLRNTLKFGNQEIMQMEFQMKYQTL